MEYISRFTNLTDRILYKALYCREVEKIIQTLSKKGIIKCPIYLSVGQELPPAVLSELLPDAKIFAQHRAHSYFLCFGGAVRELIKKLKSKEGSASIQIKNKMYGHSGLMGDQGPIAVGAALAGMHPVVCVLGDASAEEDYVLGAIGFASKKKLPITFLIEDNNLSILTEKTVRRNWELSDVGSALKLEKSLSSSDELLELIEKMKDAIESMPSLINVSVTRLCWHAGNNMNDANLPDRLNDLINKSNQKNLIQESVFVELKDLLNEFS